MYFVAICQDWYATVPACWILLKTKSLVWPPKNCDATVESKRSTQPSDDWMPIRYTRLVGPFATYEEARSVEISTVDLSAKNEEALEGMASGPQKLPEQNDDDNDELICPKRRKCEGRQENIMSDNQYNNHGDINGTMSTSRMCRIMSQNPPAELIYQSGENTDSVGGEVYHTEDPSTSYARPQKTWNVPNANTSTQHRTSERNDDEHEHRQCCRACRRTTEDILRKVDAILTYLKGDVNMPQNNQDLTILPQFPIQNLEELDYLNRILAQDETARAQYTTMVKNIGGKDPRKHMRQALSLVLSDELSCKLSWTGQKNSIRAKDMKCIEQMIATMIKAGRTTMYDMQEVVQRWLQHASDRVRYNDKKNNCGF